MWNRAMLILAMLILAIPILVKIHVAGAVHGITMAILQRLVLHGLRAFRANL